MGKRGPGAKTRTQVIAATAEYLSSAKRGLTAAERKEWDRIVRCKSPGSYREDDVDELTAYCRNLTLSKRYEAGMLEALDADNLERADWFSKRYEKAVSLLLALSRMLQIGPATRDTRRHAAKASEAGLTAKKSSRTGLMYGDQAQAEAEKVLN